MATLLLFFIYIAFIGLGIPDSLLGTAWPAIYQDFQVPIASLNILTLVLQGATVIASLNSARLIRTLGTNKTVVISTFATAIGLFGFSLAPNFLWLVFCSIPLGLGGGAIDAALNNYVALHYQAIHMNFLHCFYGIGITMSPLLMSQILGGGQSWHQGYRSMFFVQLVIAFLMVFSQPLWGKVQAKWAQVQEESQPKQISLFHLSKNPKVRLVWLVFISSCGLEFTSGIWGASYFVQVREIPVAAAAGVLTFYYLGMTLGRFFSGVLSRFLTTWQIIFIGEGIIFGALLLLIFPLPQTFAALPLFFIGLGNGPLFPNFTHLTPKTFGRNYSQAVIGSQMAAAYIGVMLIPPLFGWLADQWSLHLFPFFLLLLTILLTAASYLLKNEKTTNKNSSD